MEVLKVINLFEIKKFLFDGLRKPKNVAVSVGALSAIYAVYITIKVYLKKRKYRHIPGPPTNGLLGFYKGNVSEINKAMKKGKIIPELFAEWHELYGDVFKIQVFNQIAVITTDRKAIKEVLIEKNYPKSPNQGDRSGFPFGERLLGYGLVTEMDHDRWKSRRAVLNAGFHRNVLMTFVDHFNQITDILNDKLRTMADGKTVVHLFNEINRATLDAIALIAFGMNTDAVTQKDSVLNLYLSKVLQTLMKTTVDPFMKYRPIKYREVREFKRIARFVRKIGRDKIMERIRAMENNEHVPNDILTSILEGFKGQELDIEGMVDDFVTFFVAGQETTANALSFCFLEMGKNPEIVKKAREEIDRVLGERSEVTYQDVNELKYCSAIFKETLRLYPPAPAISRQIKDNLNVNGCEIPENTQLIMSTFVMGRSEKYFKNPLEFQPERFLKTNESEPGSGIENYVYFPFSLGPRNCIGQNFAQIEGVIVIAKMVQKFDIKLDPTQSMALDQALTLRPKDGTRCFLTLRS